MAKESKRAVKAEGSGTQQRECPGDDPDGQCRAHGCARWRCADRARANERVQDALARAHRRAIGLETGVEELRRAVRVLDRCAEEFNGRFTAVELLQILAMHMASQWTIYPDQWTDRQVREALRGRPPTWNAETGDAEYDTEVELA